MTKFRKSWNGPQINLGLSIVMTLKRCIYVFTMLFPLMAALTSSAAIAQERVLEEQRKSRRIALVIGIGEYAQNSQGDYRPLKRLSNPCNDIDRIMKVLEDEGWDPEKEIIRVCDGRRSHIRDAIDAFKDAYLDQDGTFGFIYYAGHGIQMQNDTYFFGTDSQIDIKKAASLATVHPGGNLLRGGVRLFGDLISQLGDAGSGSIFVVIDACRETPIDQYVRKNGKLVSEFFGTEQSYPKPALGIKLLYSTAFGELASDGAAAGSPFSLVFEKELKNEGRVDALVARVIKGVKDATKHAKLKQIPDTTGSLNPPPPEGCLLKCGAK